jgi:integrase
MKLTVLQIKNAKPKEKEYKLSDGKGLYLLVNPNSSKYWRFRYKYLRKEKTLALGIFPEVSLNEARERTLEARRQIRVEQKDPSAERKKGKTAQEIQERRTFEKAAVAWVKTKEEAWSTDHTKRVMRSFKADIFPSIGKRPITDLGVPEILAVLKKVEDRDALELASRLLQRITSVFQYAVQIGWTNINPARELRGALKTRKVKHVPSISPKDLPVLLRDIENYHGQPITKLALSFCMLTFVRPGEARFARWDEFDTEKKIWRISADRMKMDTDHLVPMSTQLIDLLEEVRAISRNDTLVFHSPSHTRTPLSENTMNHALHRMGYKGKATTHGFRATASSILNEHQFSPDAIERQLSHLDRNTVRSSYTHHAHYLDERRKMMQWWADYLDKLKAGAEIIPITKDV